MDGKSEEADEAEAPQSSPECLAGKVSVASASPSPSGCVAAPSVINLGYLHWLFPRSHMSLRKFPVSECSSVWGDVLMFPAQPSPGDSTILTRSTSDPELRLWILSVSSSLQPSQQLVSLSSLLALRPNNLQCSLSLWSPHLLPLLILSYTSVLLRAFPFSSFSLLLTSPNTLVSVVGLGIESITAFGWDMLKKIQFPNNKSALVLSGKSCSFMKQDE